jgi:hypothetical protein
MSAPTGCGHSVAQGYAQEKQLDSAARAQLRVELISSIHVLDDGARAVSAAGGFRVPLALAILVLDGFRVARDFLLLSGRSRRSESHGSGRVPKTHR